MVDYFAIESYQVEKYGKDRWILANRTTRRVAPRRTLWVALGKKNKKWIRHEYYFVSHIMYCLQEVPAVYTPKKSDLDSKNIQLPLILYY